MSLLEDWKLANNHSPSFSNLRPAVSNIIREGASSSSVQGQWHNASTSAIADALSPSIGQNRWQPPSRGRVKCNIAVAFSDQFNKTGSGICIRDEEGTFILAKSIPIYPKCSVDTGEAWALHHAMEWLSDMSFDSLDFCSDSKSIVNAFNQNQVDRNGSYVIGLPTFIFILFYKF